MASDNKDRIIMVIPSINGAHLLERMLPTLRVKPDSVVVLDQGSTDNTARICREAGVELLQLGQAHTYTQACNIGARLARQRGKPFLCVANNDIVFRTDVLSELLAEMDRDPKLGIVAPSQVILDPTNDIDVLARRVSWNLDEVAFLHDFTQTPAPPRLEADFCELTCALIRMSVVMETGFLDNTYAFYHEDADFCFRMRKAGYSAAYLPQSQIYHFTSSTFRRRRQEQLDYFRRNRSYFARKHLGYGVHDPKGRGSWPGEATTSARRLYPVLHRFGMIEEGRPSFSVGRIGPMTSGYLLTPQRSATLSKRELALRDQYHVVLATSGEVVESLRSAGFTSAHAPLGIDPDLFNPWGPDANVASGFEGTTYLAIADLFDHRPLIRILQAWARFVTKCPRARLIVAGTRLSRFMDRKPDAAFRHGLTNISYYAAEGLELHETKTPLDDQALAALYRSVDFTVIGRAEGSSLIMAESLACGTPVVFDPACPDIAALHRDVTGGATIKLDQSRSDDGLQTAFEQSERISATERAALAMTERYGVLGHTTLRHTAMAVRQALEMTQEREPGRFIRQLQPPQGIAEQTSMPLPPPQVSSITAMRSRVSRSMARRLTMTAAKAVRFGEIWQQRGLSAGLAGLAAHIRQAAPPSHAVPNVAPSPPPTEPKDASPLLIGYIDAQLGVGQSLRGLAIALADSGTPFSIYPFGVGVEGRRSVPIMTERYDEVTLHDINVIEVSPAELPRVFANIGPDHFDGSYNVLRTYWELAMGPAAWRRDHGMERIDEIWAPNEFCATAFRDFFDGPIFIVPPCLEIAHVARPAQDGRARFGLEANTFYFLFSFDYYSFPERKNPLGTLRAFLTAFADRDHPVGLVVKATGADSHFPAVKKEIIAAAEADGRITIIDASLSRADMLSLIACTDCYVSLHRSEGFGLGMAEAMAMGKPVIATGYSGNSEFVTEQTGYPIPFTLIPVRPDEYVHTEGQVWADPDEDRCVEAMRAVVEHPEEAASRARAGRMFVEGRYGTASVGRIAAERLEAIQLSRRS